MTKKSSFILYFGYKKHLALLSDEERGKLLMAVFDFAENGQAPKLTGATAMAFSFIQDQMERDANRYAAVCERNRKNGAKGGRPPKATKSDDNPKKPKITERLSGKPKKPDYDYDYDYDSGYDSDIDDDKGNDTIPPLSPHKNTKIAISKSKSKYSDKVKFAEFVSLTNDEYSSLVAKLGEPGAKRCIEILDNYKGANGKKYKSDYRAILNWVISRFEEEGSKRSVNRNGAYRQAPGFTTSDINYEEAFAGWPQDETENILEGGQTDGVGK